MENEAPRYAQWIPTAGGYVANGNVVSRTPLYNNGKLKTEVDTSEFGNTTPQASVSQQNIKNIVNAQSPETQSLLTNGGITAANTEGSNKDANPLMTGAGSLASLNNNTENMPLGPINTPATHSNIAGDTPGTPLEESQRRYQQYVATNNIQGQINELVTQSNLTGEDYSAEIQNLTKQRQQKIENIDNDYSQRISTAMMVGDAETANALRQEQASWRNSVGYQDAMMQKYQTAQEDLIQDYEYTYLTGVKDIGNMLMQALPGILSFQYDPMQDMALQNAQAQVELRMRNNMSATGMYYSSTTQYAIAQAIGELVPVYQKMAREEAVENFKLLQQTASFLMDLEQSQFDLWKGQLDVKFKENADKRAEVEAAWDRVNQMGYVDNETSAILGIPAGTESYATRKAMTDKINKIDEEERSLLQKKALERYATDLAMEKMARQSELDMQEYVNKSIVDESVYQSKAYTDYYYDSLPEDQKAANDRILQGMKNTGSNKGSTTGSGGTGTGKPAVQSDVASKLSGIGIPDETLTKLQDIVDGDYTSEEKKNFFNKNKVQPVDNQDVSGLYQNDPLGQSQSKLYSPEVKAAAVQTANDANSLMLRQYIEGNVFPRIDETMSSFGGDFGKTETALKSAMSSANEEALWMSQLDSATKAQDIAKIYEHIIDRVASTNNFDYSRTNFNDNYKAEKERAQNDIIKQVRKNEALGNLAGEVADILTTYSATVNNGEDTYRDNLIGNTWRKGKENVETIINGATVLGKDIVDTVPGVVEKGTKKTAGAIKTGMTNIYNKMVDSLNSK